MNTLGAHEVLELHEVLNDAIHGLNTMRLYRPYAQDQQLQAMMDRQINAMVMEYNHMVQTAHQQGGSQAVPARRGQMQMQMPQSFQPTYGLRNPQTQMPAGSVEEIDDVDVTICLVNCHKQTAGLKMKATLEMANPALRQMMQTAANSSADMAYESFQYANHKGYYQVPTLKDTTANTFMHAYGTAQQAPMHQHGTHMM
ncbi:spore coat protein [Xylanibacillus composti]|uniref:Coat protein F n=1 Tax=Xylanibacillus composti TaxID=1572762 RepID=A0A8J4H8N9_9BACL|nr:spore coat protein [Xylanibacillus composti]MDT9725722.1 spore coat protein [Xylanibacillus composti]GIQ71139.1 coat protein F [Xylanibacillus composti]